MFRICCGTLVLALMTAVANAAPSVHVALLGAIVTHDANGVVKLTPLADRAPAPGDTIRYTVTAANDGADPARALVQNARIPAGTKFHAGSASASAAAVVEFSLDEGKTWAERPLVVAHTPSGDTKVPADPATFTMLRWTAATGLPARSKERFTYEVTVR